MVYQDEGWDQCRGEDCVGPPHIYNVKMLAKREHFALRIAK